MRHSDVIDQASDVAEQMLHAAVQRQRSKVAAEELKAFGYCHYCSEPVPPSFKFCNASCRDDWEAVDAARKRNGG